MPWSNRHPDQSPVTSLGSSSADSQHGTQGRVEPELSYYCYSPAQNPAWPSTPGTKARTNALQSHPRSAHVSPAALSTVPAPFSPPTWPCDASSHQACLSHLLLFHVPQKMHPGNHPPPCLPSLLLPPSRTSGVFLGQTPSPTSSAAAPL